MPISPLPDPNYPQNTDRVRGDEMRPILSSIVFKSNEIGALANDLEERLTSAESSISSQESSIVELQEELRSFETKFVRIGLSQVLANNDSINLIDLCLSPAIKTVSNFPELRTEQLDLDVVSAINVLKTPAIDRFVSYAWYVRLTGAFGGGDNNPRGLFLELRRGLDATLVSSKNLYVDIAAAAAKAQIDSTTKTYNASDNFSVTGFYLPLFNFSGTNYTIEEIEICFRGV